MFISHFFYAIQEGPLTLLELGVLRRRNQIMSGTGVDPLYVQVHLTQWTVSNIIFAQLISHCHRPAASFWVILMDFSPA
jgi:hypothetical protein